MTQSHTRPDARAVEATAKAEQDLEEDPMVCIHCDAPFVSRVRPCPGCHRSQDVLCGIPGCVCMVGHDPHADDEEG